MITRFITDVTTKFNPFSPRAKPARLFLSFLPPNARASGMSITTQLLAKSSAEPASLTVKFSTFPQKIEYGKELFLPFVLFANPDTLRQQRTARR